MAVRYNYASIDVVQAAEKRVENVFKNGLPVYLSFSGGKDSLCLAHITMNLIQQGKINPSQLTVQFIDEEAIFPCIEDMVRKWRKRFILAGAQFEWFCIEVKHFNCFNELSNDESFICWDSRKADVWVRKPPTFAIRTHPLLKPREDTYQDFLPRACMDGISIVGVRASESIQRLKYMSKMNMSGGSITGRYQIFPIYDWTDKDVWLYLKENDIEIPEIYLYLWQIGTSRKALRVSQFFSIDTAKSLVRMNEYYPDLMERIIRREPNAYLAALYWDSEMFGRSSKKRKQLEGDNKEVDYKAKLLEIFNDFDKNFTTPHKRKIASSYRNFFVQIGAIATNKDYKRIYEGLMSGDPKSRTLRALYQQVYGGYIDKAKKERMEVGNK